MALAQWLQFVIGSKGKNDSPAIVQCGCCGEKIQQSQSFKTRCLKCDKTMAVCKDDRVVNACLECSHLTERCKVCSGKRSRKALYPAFCRNCEREILVCKDDLVNTVCEKC